MDIRYDQSLGREETHFTNRYTEDLTAGSFTPVYSSFFFFFPLPDMNFLLSD